MLYIDVKKHLEGFDLDIQLEVHEGRTGLLGASGSGKSMTLKMIAGIERPDEGCIILNDRVLFDSKKKINIPARERNVGYLFQNYALFPHMNVRQNIAIGMRRHTKEEKNREVEKRVKELRLEGLEMRYPRQLSGGQQQRVAIGRMLAANPEILMFDEPFSALDFHLRDQMQEQLLEILETLDTTSLIVTHDIDEAYRLCHKIAVVNRGKIDVFHTKEKVFEKPTTLSAALITGCKNISKVKKLSNTKVMALDWGIELEIPFTKEEIDYIGIRAHHILLLDEPKENSFKHKVMTTSETRFNKTIMLQLTEQEHTNSQLRLDIDKEWWRSTMGNKENLAYVYLPKAHLLLLRQ